MGNIPTTNPNAEEYKFGIIDNWGVFHLKLQDNHIPILCNHDDVMRRKDPNHFCRFQCSDFSGPSKAHDGKTCVKLLCSGRTFMFDRFINIPNVKFKENENEPTDEEYNDLSDEDLLNKLRIHPDLEGEIKEDA